PLIGENRILVSAGLRQLNETKRAGILALKSVAKISDKIGAYEVGFQLAPRLNAAGRLETAEESLNLLRARPRRSHADRAGPRHPQSRTPADRARHRRAGRRRRALEVQPGNRLRHR